VSRRDYNILQQEEAPDRRLQYDLHTHGNTTEYASSTITAASYAIAGGSSD
jgi:uncharacterized membrane protein YecN with MAPEG domain